MAAFSGKQGSVEFNNAVTPIANVLSWTIDATADVADATVMSAVAYTAATHWKDFEIGFKDWTGTVECLLDDSGLDPDLDTDFAQDTNGLTLTLFAGMISTDQQEGATVRKYEGNALITGISVNVDKNDVVKVTYTFQGSGALSVAASDAT